MDKSMSETDLNQLCQDKTPPDYVYTRNKRRRGEYEGTSDIKSFISSLMSDQQQEIKQIRLLLANIQQTNTNIESSIAFLTAQNQDMKNRIELLERQSVKEKDYITLLENKIEDMQISNRKSNFQLKNVPRMTGETKEDLIGAVLCLAKTIDCKFEERSIKDIYRVSSKKDELNSPIIVETSSTLLKTDFLKMCKSFNTRHKSKLAAKHLGCRTNTDAPIFVAEQLTAKGSRLHFLARDLVRAKKFKFCWTSIWQSISKER